MKTILIDACERDIKKFRLNKKRMKLSELQQLIRGEMFRESLEKTVGISKKNRLDKLTGNDIDDIITTVRKNA